MAMIYYSRNIKAKTKRNHVQASKRSLPVESHRTHLIPQQQSCDMCEMLSTWESSLETQSPGFLLGVGNIGTLSA